MKLRPYQADIPPQVHAAWQTIDNALVVLPTGAGKTVTFSSIVHHHVGASCSIAHRQELVSQISVALAREGVRHRIIGPRSIIQNIVHLHIDELGRSYYDPQSLQAVAGVDTLVRRYDELKDWLKQVTLVIQDEAHHVLKNNKWGKAISYFPNAKVLGVTATPLRADGKGLGMHVDGIFQELIVGPDMRWLINNKYLTEYRVFAPPNDLRLDDVEIGSTGDYKPKQLSAAVERSHIIGDVVEQYLKIARGKIGITFAPDVKIATDIAAQYNAAGVPAEVLSAKTDDRVRANCTKRLKNRELLQLVNVDLFGEGYDLPAIEVVSMARPTESYGLFVQQFGRGLRIMEGKTEAIIIDHVGNCMRHGLPDAPREWTLNRRERRGKSAAIIPVRTCQHCTAVYERIYNRCPYCHHVPHYAGGGNRNIEFVDGDLCELDPAKLAEMRGEIARIDGPANYSHLGGAARGGAEKQHRLRQHMQQQLRDSISQWAGYHKHHGRSLSEQYRRFFFRFGTDVATAQTLGRREAEELKALIDTDIQEMHDGLMQ